MLLSFVSAGMVHLILLIGIVSFVISWWLGGMLMQYKLPVQLTCLLVVCFGIYLEGGLATEASWQAKVTALEAKLAKSSVESANSNTVIVSKVLNKKQKIRGKSNTIIEYVDREVVKYDNSCTIPHEVIQTHNAASVNDPLLLLFVPHTSLKLAPKK